MTPNSRNVFFAAICLSPLAPAIMIPGAGVLLSLAIVAAALLFIKRSRNGTLAFYQGSIARSLALGVAAGALLQIALYYLLEPFIEYLTQSEIALENFDAVRGNFSNYLMLLAVGLLFGGIAEELIFRGFVIGWGVTIFGKHSGTALAFLSAAAFGVAHFYQGIAGVLATAVVGLLLGLFYLLMERQLLPVIVAHMTINFIGITLIYLGYY